MASRLARSSSCPRAQIRLLLELTLSLGGVGRGDENLGSLPVAIPPPRSTKVSHPRPVSEMIASRFVHVGSGPGDPMRRRDFIAVVGAIAIARPPSVRAESRRVYVVSVFRAGATLPAERRAVFSEALRNLGWIEGKNIAFVDRFAENRIERLSEVAAELVRLKVDIIVVIGTQAAIAVRRATSSIPIVMAPGSDPVEVGLVASLARPGGNVTGLSIMAPEVGGKRLELLKEIFPGASRVAVLWNADTPSSALVFKEIKRAATILGIEVQPLEVAGSSGFDGAFEAAVRERVDALIAI